MGWRRVLASSIALGFLIGVYFNLTSFSKLNKENNHPIALHENRSLRETALSNPHVHVREKFAFSYWMRENIEGQTVFASPETFSELDRLEWTMSVDLVPITATPTVSSSAPFLSSIKSSASLVDQKFLLVEGDGPFVVVREPEKQHLLIVPKTRL